MSDSEAGLVPSCSRRHRWLECKLSWQLGGQPGVPTGEHTSASSQQQAAELEEQQIRSPQVPTLFMRILASSTVSSASTMHTVSLRFLPCRSAQWGQQQRQCGGHMLGGSCSGSSM